MKTVNEIWKPIYSGYYSVSNLGRIRRDTGGQGTWAGRILKAYWVGAGYLSVRISTPEVGCIPAYVHRLVAENFIGPCPKGKEVNHKDTNKLNNRADNLEYVTPKKNMEHASKFGLTRKGKHYKTRSFGNERLSESQVKEIRRLYRPSPGTKNAFTSVALAKKYGVSHILVLLIAKNKAYEWVK